MQTTQHARCPVLLHPACAHNPNAIRAVQQATGRTVVVFNGTPSLASAPMHLFCIGEAKALGIITELKIDHAGPTSESDTGPFGGAA